MNAIKFPDMLNNNKANIIEGIDATAQNLKYLLLSNKLTLLGDPYFGANLQKLLYESNNVVLRDLVVDEIYTTISTFMPQIRVLRKNINVDSDGNKIIVDIKAQNLLDFSFAEYSIVLTNVEEL
jgi:phage baseplate assembly protein W